MLRITNELFGRPPTLKFFVSSRMDGTLSNERIAAARAVEERGTARAWYWERDAAAGPYCSESVCVRHAETSDGLFLIIGGGLTPIIHREYEAAKKGGAPVFILIKYGACLPDEVQQFIAAEREYAVTAPFRNLKTLREAIRQAIDTYGVLAWRVRQEGTRLELAERQRKRAWELNEQALGLAEQGKRSEAIDCWHEMEAIGTELNDQYIVSTARHNFGAQAHRSGDYDEARRLYVGTLRSKLAIGDRFGVFQLLLNLAGVAEMEGKLAQAEQLLSDLEGVLRALHEPELLATLYGNFGALAVRHGDLASAGKYLLRSLRYARQSARRAHEVICMRNLGLLRFNQNRFDVAIQWFRKALALAEKHHLTLQVQAIHRHLAGTLQAAGHVEEAIEELERVRGIAERVGDQLDATVATYELGMLLLLAGNVEAVATHLEPSLASFEQLGAVAWQARALRGMLDADRIRRDPECAKKHVGELLRVTPQKDFAGRAEALKAAARVLLASQANPREASKYYERGLNAMRKHLPAAELAWEFTLAGATLSQHGAAEFSLSFFDRALELYAAQGDRHMVCHVLNDRGNALARLGRNEEAKQDFRMCIDTAIEVGDMDHELKGLLNLGEITRRQGAVDEALETLTSLTGRAHGDPRIEADAHGNLGLAFMDRGDLDSAFEAYTLMLHAAQRGRHMALEAEALLQLGWIESKRGHLGRAASHYRIAARISHGVDDRNRVIEALASLVEVESARERVEETQEALQRLVDAIGPNGGGQEVWLRVAAGGRYWARRGELAAAATLFAFSIVFAMDDQASSEPDQVTALTRPLVYLVLAARHDQVDQDALFESVVREMAQRQFIGEDIFRPMLTEVSRSTPDIQDPETSGVQARCPLNQSDQVTS